MRRQLEVAIALIRSVGDDEANFVAAGLIMEILQEEGIGFLYELIGCLSSLNKQFVEGWAQSLGMTFDDLFPQLATQLTLSVDD